MVGFLRGLAYGVVLIAAGWIMGSIYPAPTTLTAPIKGRTDLLLARVDLSPDGLARLRASLTAEQFTQLSHNAAEIAASSGQAIIVERAEDLDEHVEAVEARAQEIAFPAGVAAFENALSLCPGMTVTNAPAADAARQVRNYARIVNVSGVALAVNPTRGACLSSGFGARGSRLHKGVDYYSGDGGPILAGGAGTVVEKKYRDDYGNMVLIDHGHGVYTRYAHLSNFASGLDVGAHVEAGQQIGLMGNTAAYRIPVHLHYELLLGDYANPKGSFGLTPHSPFEYPAAG